MAASSTERGYGSAHRKKRAVIQKRMDAGEVFTCWRCGKPIHQGDQFDLGHDDNDRTQYMGPEHVGCNRATSTHKAMIVVDDSRVW